jgi:hypothetical protein
MLFLTQHGTPLTAEGAKMIFRRIEAQTGIRCNAHAWRRTCPVEFLCGGDRYQECPRCRYQ